MRRAKLLNIDMGDILEIIRHRSFIVNMPRHDLIGSINYSHERDSLLIRLESLDFDEIPEGEEFPIIKPIIHHRQCLSRGMAREEMKVLFSEHCSGWTERDKIEFILDYFFGEYSQETDKKLI